MLFRSARAAVYAFVEGELTANVPKLTKIVDKSTYARVNYYVGEAILAKLYLNSGIYLGTGAPTAANLDKSLAASNEIINSAKYGLESDYASNFKFNNETSKENIFVIPYDQVNAQGFNLVQMTLHYLSQKTFNLDSQPWNGYCSLSEFYNSYEDKDSRKKSSFLVGPQFASDGITRLIDDQAEPNDPDGKPLTFTPEVNALEPNCLRQAGARVFKYQFQNGATPNMNNDMPLFRYADILLVKAEALWRKNAADLDALALVNVVRARANASPYLITDMTATKLLAERGREMFAEAVRRQDMIRFDAYAKPFQFKTTTDLACKNVFPIPQKQIDANTKLVQNDCYK